MIAIVITDPPALGAEIQTRTIPATHVRVSETGVRSEWFVYLAGLFGQFDALVLPSAQVFPFDSDWTWPREVAGRHMTTYHQWMEVVIPATLAGLPALSVPVGFSPDGLPMGLQIMGQRGDDAGMLRLAEAYHQVTDWPGRRPPTL